MKVSMSTAGSMTFGDAICKMLENFLTTLATSLLVIVEMIFRNVARLITAVISRQGKLTDVAAMAYLMWCQNWDSCKLLVPHTKQLL